MTACVNKNYKRRAAGVVTASLVGALTLGGVSLAVATPALAAEMELQAADWTTNAKVSAATDGAGSQLSGDLSRQTFKKGSGKFLVPTRLSGAEDTEVTPDMLSYTGGGSLTGADYDSAATYFNGSTVDAGSYTVTVTGKDKKTVSFTFQVADAEGKTVRAYAGDDVNDSTFTYNGSAQQIKFVDSDDVELEASVDNNDANNYIVEYYDSLGNKLVDTGMAVAPTNAGTYVAKLSKGTAAKPVPDYVVTVTVGQLDLSKAKLTVDKTTFASNAVKGLIVNGVPNTDGNTNHNVFGLAVTSVRHSDGTTGYDGNKHGTYTVSVSKDATTPNPNVAYSDVTFTFSNIEHDLSTDGTTAGQSQLFYGKQQLANNSGKVSVDLAKGEKFDASKLSLTYKDKDGKAHTVASDGLELSFVKGGKTVSGIDGQGEYDVTATIKAFEDFYSENRWTGGSKTFEVNVTGTTVASDDVAFRLDGKLSGTEGSVVYDGTDALKRLQVTVKDGDGNTLKEGTDYTLEAKSGAKVVESAVDAGEYVVTVKPITFKMDDTETFTLKVKQVRVGQNKKDSDSNPIANAGLKDLLYTNTPASYPSPAVYVNDAVGYTGSAVAVPAVRYAKVADDKLVQRDGETVFETLDASLYNVVSITYSETDKTVTTGKVVSGAKDEGYYKVRLALTEQAAKNYTLEDTDFVFQVKAYEPFSDVKSPAWYASAVETARHNGYVNGMSGTKLFAPEADITRADAVGILFNMAGGNDAKGADDFKFTDDEGFDTGFSDVDGHAYYAKALAWAHKAGVVNGHDGAFRPTDKVSRQEFAAMLFNYAKSTGQYSAAEGDALSKLADADTVSAWATEAVNWAVSHKVMGNGGRVSGQSSIIRAEVAAMAVNFQPKNLNADKANDPRK